MEVLIFIPTDEACLIFPNAFQLALIRQLQAHVKLIAFGSENKESRESHDHTKRLNR